MLKHVREFWEYGKPLGFGEPVQQGDGHFRMTHANGQYVTLSGSMFDGKEKLRIIGDMHRVAEIAAVKPNAAKHTFKKEHSRLYLDRSENEERAIEKAARLAAEWDDTIARLQKISDLYDKEGRNPTDDALGWALWQKFDAIEADLQDINRVPTVTIPWPKVVTHDEYVDLWLGRWPTPANPPAPSSPSASGGLLWEAPPKTRRGRESTWDPVVAELKTRPGEWAVVKQDCSASTADYLKRTYPGLEVRSRGVKNSRAERIYARWVGETKE
ncbi:hypothetical protein MUN77_01390 [Leucobacter allii]|uniref:hypothetical protein n=1 Tax=Leucobacter allii TaxID=2932247 RepID=UPI001FD0AF8A|nr:hypothetical protein [Leucobacter allii]UOR02014.1 hypothetical protein MUN77_01390 [Leucobacter allii]